MFEAYIKELQKKGTAITWNDMESYLKDNLGLYGAIKVDASDDKLIKDSFNKTFVEKQTEDIKTLYATYSNFVADVFGVFNKYTGLGWTTTGHTGDFTPVFAIGVGAEEFNGLNDNTDLPKKIAKIANVKF